MEENSQPYLDDLKDSRDLEKAAICGEPSYVWRSGQERRLRMIQNAAGDRISRKVLENGCGIGMYLERLSRQANQIIGLEYDFDRSLSAHQGIAINRSNSHLINAAGEGLPFEDDTFDLILSHEVLEHVLDDRMSVAEMVRALKPGGRMVIFAPNRGYPFETHGIYWRGHYHFGNIPLINYLPRSLRDRLAPHVRVYTTADLRSLFEDLPVQYVTRTVIFGAYDNIIARWPVVGESLRTVLQALERTPLGIFGLSHFWVVEKE